MATVKTRGVVRTAARRRSSQRLTLKPAKTRRGLLLGTSLTGGAVMAFGAMVAITNPAWAAETLTNACHNNPLNTYVCSGPDSPDNAAIELDPANTFIAAFGASGPYLPFEWNGNSGGAPAVTINAGGHSTTGNGIEFNAGSSITNAGGEGLYVYDVGDVVINVNAATTSPSHPEGSITGLGAGIHVDGQEYDTEGDPLGGLGSSVTVNVNGHVEGTGLDSSGIEIENVALARVNNHTYLSVMGGDGDYIHDVGQAVVNNTSGLTAGLTYNGLKIETIKNTTSGRAVDIDNTIGGVIAGATNGIYMRDVIGIGEGDGDVYVDNSGAYNNSTHQWIAGGLIAGRGNDGIFFDGVDTLHNTGDFTVDNSFTREGGITLSNLDVRVYDESESAGLLDGQLPNNDTFNTGIFGGQNGINASFIQGQAIIYNQDGRIAGQNGDGIQLNTVGGGVYVENSAGWANDSEGAPWVDGGTIWGAVNGIAINGADGDIEGMGAVVVDNFEGSIFGGQNGIVVSESLGSVLIGNIGGRIQGFWGDGIDASAFAISESDVVVTVLNGGTSYGGSEGLGQEGWIIGADTAINIASTYALVSNDVGGVIVGDGQRDEPVIRILTGTETSVSGNGPEYGEGGPTVLDSAWEGSALVSNDGIMTSHSNPFVDLDFWPFPDTNVVPAVNINTQAIIADANDIVQFAYTGGASGSINDLSSGGSIEDYWQTSSDLLLVTEGGAATLLNGTRLSSNINNEFGDDQVGNLSEGSGGIMFGRVVMTGAGEHVYTDTGEGDFGEERLVGNYVLNLGQWFTTNEDGLTDREFGNIVYGDFHGEIDNGGVIQTAFGEGGDYTTFVVNEFYNGIGSGWLNFDNQLTVLGSESGGRGFDGLISMTDGDALDTTVIYGDYYGQEPGNSSYRAYLAVDVNFAPTSEGGASDVLQIGGDSESDWANVYGTTGIIAHKLNQESDPATKIGDRIAVVYAFTNDDGSCMDAWCKDGDDFFVSELSPDYVNVGGIGFIRDGMFMWGLQQRDLAPDPETDWVATWGPDAADQPVLISSLQNAWYETGGVVEDHVYGNIYPKPSGGSGADLPMSDNSVAPPPSGPPQQSSIWGRITGNWSTRDTSVTETAPPLTFDTSTNQNTYSITGGLEFRPQGGDSSTRLGIFGGYLNTSTSFDSYSATSKSSGGLVGGYAAWINGPWYIDGEVKADFLSVDYTSPSVSVSTNAVTVGVLANAGYRIDNGRTFLEPIVSLAYANTSLGDTTGGGASIDYSNGQTFKAGAGARIGVTTGAAGGSQAEFDILGKVWNEFSGNNQVTVTDGVNTTTFTDNVSGFSGEVVGRATLYNADRSASGFVSFGGKFGAGSTSISAKAGLRKNF